LRLWFEEQLAGITLDDTETAGVDAPLRTYTDMKAILQSYAWHETSLDSRAVLVWERANARSI